MKGVFNLSTKPRNIQYGVMDLMKFIFSLLIVIAHYIIENAHGKVSYLIEYGVSIYVIVVPFFFCSAGFLVFRRFSHDLNDEKKYIVSYCKRILIMYLCWSVLYVAINIATWVRFGVTKEEVFKYFLNAVFYSTYKTIWFLPALCVGVVMTYLFIKKIGIKYTALIAVLFYLIGSFGVSYSFLLQDNQILNVYNYIFVSARNGFFNGFPFVFIGALLAQRIENNEKKSFFMNIVLTILFGICFIAEAFVLKFVFKSVNVNTLLFLFPFTYFFVKLCISIPLESGRVLKWMRKMSTVIFLSQRIFLTALPCLFPESIFASLLNGNAYIGCVYVLVATFITSALLVFLSGKSKLISILC